jgi:hypothetical protein
LYVLGFEENHFERNWKILSINGIESNNALLGGRVYGKLT